MSKKLLFLLPIAMLALTGCGKDDGKKSEEPEKEAPASLVVNKETLGEHEIAGSTYFAEAGSFEVSGYSFSFTTDLGYSAARTGEKNYFNEQGVMQFKKQGLGKTVALHTAYPAKKVTFECLNTYSTQESQYFPVVLAGAEDDDTKAGVACEQTGTVNGTIVPGAKQGNKKEGEVVVGYDVYSYRFTYSLPEGTQFVSFSAGEGAAYVLSVTIEK